MHTVATIRGNEGALGAPFVVPGKAARAVKNMTYASAREIGEYHRRYLAALPIALGRLYASAARWSGPQLDGSVASLRPLGHWFITRILADEPDGLDGLPVWWDDREAPAIFDFMAEGRLTARQLRLTDQVHAYFANVLLNEYPGAHWVSFRGYNPLDIRNGSTMLVLDSDNRPLATDATVHFVPHDVINGKHDPRPDALFEAAIEHLSVGRPALAV